MEKQNPIQKEVTEKYAIYCSPVSKCCGPDRHCQSTSHILPTGREVWKHCGCDDFSQA
ncbi:hypothetical protein [Bacillus wiedmannii]|uniref:hypothetical protein n=1 Tax=Bacillus wiedmannii TaxID=1890302 RepID=UPI0021D1C2A9|nr:hypothetical protein [Bacillus wiedmannii]MCU5096109.1 hypothetical protein [Bacillus wiedmannii]